MRVAMVGAGYVGLVSGACFADFGHIVTCVDNDAEKIGALNAGQMPIYEPGLADLVARNVRDGRLAFSADFGRILGDTDVTFIAAGTPSRRGDGHADLTHVHAAAREIAKGLAGFSVVVMKSTVPVGTGDEVEAILRSARPDLDVAVVSNPEFLREGAAIRDFKHPDRIVVGLEDARAQDVLAELYRPLSLNVAQILYTGRRTAELIKYAANAFLATKITFINEIADLCEKVGADVEDVARGIGLDNRIGSKFLHAGPGIGGSCFPKDTLALNKTAQHESSPLRILEAVVAVNDARKSAMADRVATALGGSVRDKTIGILGLTFKPNTDDIRESPSLALISSLQRMGARIRAYDPVGMEQAKKIMSNVTFCGDEYDCAEEAEGLVIITEWEQFKALDFTKLRSCMTNPLVVDLRNIYRPEQVERFGFSYSGIGRGGLSQEARLGPKSVEKILRLRGENKIEGIQDKRAQ